MEKARCTQDNAIYSADQFAGLPIEDFLSRRQSLVCPECERRAFFRGHSQNGRDSHFGARPHAEWCQQRTAQATAGMREHTSTYAELLDPDTEIAVDLSFDSPASWGGQFDSAQDDGDEMGDGFADTAAPAHQARLSQMSVRHMRLRPLLRLLLARPDFCHSEKVMKVPGFGNARICDFFVPLQNISSRHERLAFGVFGRIVRAQYSPEFKCIWLYSEGFNNPNIYVTLDVGVYLMDRFGIRDIGFLVDVFVLVIGAVRVSINGKRYVYLDDPRHIAVIPGWDL